MTVDESGRDDVTLGVELATPGAHDRADGDDATAGDRDVGATGGIPVPSTTIPPLITKS